ncbi:MAG: ribonuclease III [Alphaproteobacteria bacterium]
MGNLEVADGGSLLPHVSGSAVTARGADGGLSALFSILGYRFRSPELLRQVLVHPSAAVTTGAVRVTVYERLEFLGDRVLGLIIADMLLTRFPGEKEGGLARRHASLVCREALAEIAREIDLGAYLILSKGEGDGGGRDNPTTLADACEAVIGAMFSDGGLAAAEAFVRPRWTVLMERESAAPPKDAKTALQEWAQGLGRPLPVYQVLSCEGPPHEPIFLVELRVEQEAPVRASGPSRRAAEQAAARILMEGKTR